MKETSDWVLVPRVPTPEMLRAFYRDSGDPRLYPEYFAVAYHDLLAAAPKPHGGDLEPVAWLVHDDPELGDYVTRSKVAADRSGRPVTPLAAASTLQNQTLNKEN